MPRWASRITLDVVDVRVERVQEITPCDCTDEGIPLLSQSTDEQRATADEWAGGFDNGHCQLVRVHFRDRWDSINARRPGCSWSDNPWVFVIEFKRVER